VKSPRARQRPGGGLSARSPVEALAFQQAQAGAGPGFPIRAQLMVAREMLGPVTTAPGDDVAQAFPLGRCGAGHLRPGAAACAAGRGPAPDGARRADPPSGGLPVGPGEAITPAEALAAYTAGSAYACRVEDELGSLSPGKQADLVVLSDDPRRVPGRQIGQIGVLATAIAGQLVHGAWPGS